MMGMERGFARKLYTAINWAVNKAANDVSQSGKATNIGYSLRDLQPKLEELYIAQYEKAIDLFGSRVRNAFKTAGFELETKAGTFSDETRNWILSEAAERSVWVSTTTGDMIRAAMLQGFDEMMTYAEVATLIQQKAGGLIAKGRATAISRTETHMAASYGSLQAARETDVAKKKIWISAEDERTREDHASADAQYSNGIPLDENFNVGGDSMSAPGMGSDPAQNINCRCSLGYLTD